MYDASYVGQTKKQLNIRTSEHRKDINKNVNNHSVITKHRLSQNHDFNWSDVKILDRDSFYQRRLIYEIFFIKRQKNSLNLQTNTEGLNDLYIPIIDKLTNI